MKNEEVEGCHVKTFLINPSDCKDAKERIRKEREQWMSQEIGRGSFPLQRVEIQFGGIQNPMKLIVEVVGDHNMQYSKYEEGIVLDVIQARWILKNIIWKELEKGMVAGFKEVLNGPFEMEEIPWDLDDAL